MREGRQETLGVGEPGDWDGEGVTSLAGRVLRVSETAWTARPEDSSPQV